MQSASDKVNTDNIESLFDFLDGEDDKHVEQTSPHLEQKRTPRPDSANRARSGSRDPNASKPFPVIRKPVSVERSGPLRAPRPGDPVEAPPALTDSIQAVPNRAPQRAVRTGHRNENSNDLGLDLDLDLDLGFGEEDWPSSEQWIDKNNRRVPTMSPERGRTSVVRALGYLLATLLIFAGVGSGLYSVPKAQTWMDQSIATGKNLLGLSTDLNTGIADDAVFDNTPPTPLVTPLATPQITEAPASFQDTPPAVIPDTAATNAPKTLNALFKEELARLESLMGQGNIEEAERILQTMDRAVYGYGKTEFTQIKENIVQLNSTAAEAEKAAAEQLAQEQAIAAEAAARQELQRLEQERAAAEALRIQEEQAALLANAAAEADRLAALQDEQSLQASESEQLRADRLTQELARLEQLDVARQERVLLEQERIAQEQLASAPSAQQTAASEAYQSNDWQAVDSSESVEQIAARQREAARQQRLTDARGRDQVIDQNAGGASTQEQLALVEPVTAPIQPAVQPTVQRRITDGDLQRVYGQFSQLQKAIENRDVNTVIQLTERSGIRVQQMMQMFQNNTSIQTRLRNVSTLDAAGEIQGTLQITRLERLDGSVTGPPLNLGSIRLSSTRQGDDWSAIRW